MEEFLKYIALFNEKKDDQKWCEEFNTYILDNEKMLQEAIINNTIKIDSQKLEEILEYISNNLSIEYRIAHNIPIHLSLGKISYDEMNKYKEYTINQLNHSYSLISDETKSKDLLRFCLENNFINKISFFDNSLFTKEILNEYKELFINWLSNDEIQEEMFLREAKKYQCIELFRFCLENNIDKRISDFIYALKDEITIDFLNLYKDKFTSFFKTHLYNYKDYSLTIFKFCLENNILDDLGILSFNSSFYTKDLLDQYKEQFIKAFNVRRVNMPTLDILEFGLENNISLLIDGFVEKSDLFNKETLNKYKKGAINFLENASTLTKNEIYKRLDLLEFCLENDVDSYSRYIFIKFSKDLTEEFFIKNKEYLKSYIQRNSIPNECLESIQLFKFFINEDIIDVGMPKDLAIYKLEYLYNINDEVLASINLNILKYDFDLLFLSKITIYKDIQDKIIGLTPHSLEIFYRVAKLLNDDSIDLSNIIVKFLENISKYEHILENTTINSLNDEALKNFIEIIIVNCDYGIHDASDLENDKFNNCKHQYFINFGNNIQTHGIDEIKEAIFQKQYGIDLTSAQFIVNRYSYNYHDLVKAGVDEKIINIIFGIKTIIECDSISKLAIIYQNIDEIKHDYQVFSNLESIIRKSYAEMYNKTYYKINENSKKCEITELQNVVYNGKEISFYEVDDDFAMQVHALGAYRNFIRPDSFKDDWNRPQIAYHGICTSYINNSEIATARPLHPILGFSSFEDSALLLGGNYDLFSDESIKNFDTSSHCPYNMLPPKVMIDATRHNHNEMVIERCKKSSNRSTYKRQPDYIVYIIDSSDNKDNFSENNRVFNETLQAAADFNLPVVVIDRTKVSKIEMAKCQNLENEFRKTHDLEILNDLFIKYFNNNVGGRFFSDKELYMKNNLFSNEALVDFYNRIIYHITNEITDNKEREVIINKIIEILNKENVNYSVSHKADKQPKPFDFDIAINKLNELLDSYNKDRIDVVETTKTR